MKILTRTISKFFYVLLVLFLLSACSKSTPTTTTSSKPAAYRLLSISDAEKCIIRDEKEGFFDKVANLEMSIQMKQNLEEMPRDSVLHKYKKMLSNDLSEFSDKEIELTKNLFDRALNLCYKIDPNINLPEIYLIKTKGKYYGSSVYYTRDNSIIIPAPMLNMDENGENNGFVRTMIHEIFHVYSRYNKGVRDKMYQRIGFEKLPNLALSDFLKKRVLYNPDGVDLRYAITVKDNKGREFKAIPAIYSRHNTYKSELPAFFSYLTFQLFEVGNRAGTWSVKNKDVGSSVEEITGFWEQVGENTRYNIHPDEICADNFVIMAFSKEKNGENLKRLTEEGLQLVKDLEAIIVN